MSESRRRRHNSALRTRSGNGENPPRQAHTQHRTKMNQTQNKGNHQNYDRVRKIVQEEGRTARNLIAYNVPVEDEEHIPKKLKSPRSPNRHSHQRSSSAPKMKTTSLRDLTPPGKIPTSFGLADTDDRSRSRPSSQSSMGPRKGDLRARYWAFLFDNLRRAVDEIYQTCETDESVVECKEVIMMLEQCTKDFKSLIQRLDMLKAYENAEEGQKPTSLAWEVRKSSPGKNLQSTQGKDNIGPSTGVARNLNFGAPPNTPPQTRLGNSWADKVKGAPPSIHAVTQPEGSITPTPESVLSQTPEPQCLDPQHKTQTALPPEEDDTDGWETVHRGGRAKRQNSTGSQGSGKDRPSHGNKHQNHSRSNQRPGNGKGRSHGLHYSQGRQEKINTSGTNHALRARTHSRDSEKENIPVFTHPPILSKTGEVDSGKKLNSSNESPPKPSRGWETIRDPPPSIPKPTKPSSEVLETVPSMPQTVSVPDSEPVENFVTVSMDDNQGDVDSNTDGTEGNRSETGFISDDEAREGDDEDDAEEELATQLENALASAMKEEDSLTSELEQEQQAALETAIAEEETWLKELERESSMEILVDTEGEGEGECGNEQEDDSEAGTTESLDSSLQQTWDWDTMVKHYDERDSTGGSTWGEMVDMEESDARTPGRVVHMHEKLSSPSRKRSPTESRKRHEEKQAKAQELREKLLQEKADRLHVLTKKVEEVRSWKEELLRQRRVTMEHKMQRAEEKRQMQLKQKIKKAHEEETKANEIAFINTLEAQNKRHDIYAKHQESEARLHDLQEERQRRVEEKAAKEAAVEERRRALEAERLARLAEMQERRRQRESEIEQKQQEREKERVEAARAKERDRETRIAALNAQQQAHIEELQKKIIQKQHESARRHKENLEQIREKAFEMSVLKHSTEDHNDAPKLVPYDKKKLCTVCNVLIPSEVYLQSHLRGKKHQQVLQDNSQGGKLSKQDIEAFNLKHISDAPLDKPDPQVASDKERQKALKKRCKKLRQRMAQRGSEYESSLAGKQQLLESEHKTKLQKLIKDLTKYLQTQDKGPWPQNKVSAMDRALGEIGRIMEKRVASDQNAFRVSGGLTVLSRILLVLQDSCTNQTPIIPTKSLVHTCSVFRLACKGNYDNAHYMLFSNKIGVLVDLTVHQLNLLIPDGSKSPESNSGIGGASGPLPVDEVASSLMQLVALVLGCLAKHNPSTNSSEASAERMSSSGDAFMNRGNDIISYVVSVGIVDKLTQYFSNVRGPLDDDSQAADFLQHSMTMLSAMAKLIARKGNTFLDKKKAADSSQLIATFRATELVGIVSLMYGMLLHSGAPERGDKPPPELPQHTISVTTMGIKMLNHMATLDLDMLQGALGEEGTWLELRHIASYLIWYCSHWTNEELLHEVILCVGYFTVLHLDNQVIIQSGQPPTVLQQLCALPFQYFSDPRLTNVLFPTLIACCYRNKLNREILEQELSCALLANFIEEKTLEMQQAKLSAKLSPVTAKKSKSSDKDGERMCLASRFPVEEWSIGQAYFKNPQD